MTHTDRVTVIQVRGTLIATLPPHPSDSTIDDLQERILERINQTNLERIEGVVLDVSDVQTVDSFFARVIVETAKMVELMGVRPILVGISPAIAITVTELGFDLGGVQTARSIDAALDALEIDSR